MSNIPVEIEEILGPEGLLSKSFSGFEFRPSQLAMAARIYEAIHKDLSVIVEAGTGTGKTFGYLVPIILSKKKAVISTGTKNLQEQIFFKDLPLLQKVSGLHVEAMMMKGRKNYLCLYKYHQTFSQASLFKTTQTKTGTDLDKWVRKTVFGDRAEIPWLMDGDPLWDNISSSSDQCLGAQCVFFDDCFINKLRNRAARSRLMIVNHHLFFADMKIKLSGFSEIIPRFQIALFDEAHNIEEISTTYFGESISTNQLMELTHDLKNLMKDLKIKPDKTRQKHLNNIRTSAEQLKTLFEDREAKGKLNKEMLAEINEGPAKIIAQGLNYIAEKTGHPGQATAYQAMRLPDDTLPFNPIIARARELSGLLDMVLHKQEHNWLNWYEKRKKTLIFHASPLDISEKLNELLYQKTPTVAFTSATLSTNGNFDYIRSRLNIPDTALEGIYPSHFDFKSQTLMFIPKDLPIPNEHDFGSKIARKISHILEQTQGRSLILFTSYQNMNLVWNLLKDRMPYTLLKQGDAPRSVLLDTFRKDVHSTLLGTSSFWQGVDVPGESLSCLIVDKLPFESPKEPIVAAKIDALREKGGNPFMEYQVPSAVITLKQGLGRLIRRSSDKGVLSILDKRIITSRYGKVFLKSLPEISLSHELADIGRFFSKPFNNAG